ncbi:MAG: hypothetical protein ACLSCB_11170 [Bifidobacterium pseudocatenulatum]
MAWKPLLFRRIVLADHLRAVQRPSHQDGAGTGRGRVHLSFRIRQVLADHSSNTSSMTHARARYDHGLAQLLADALLFLLCDSVPSDSPAIFTFVHDGSFTLLCLRRCVVLW